MEAGPQKKPVNERKKEGEKEGEKSYKIDPSGSVTRVRVGEKILTERDSAELTEAEVEQAQSVPGVKLKEA